MAQSNNIFYTDLPTSDPTPPIPPTPSNSSSCPGVWAHEEYRELRDRYDEALEKLAAANAQVASLTVLAKHARGSSVLGMGDDHGGENKPFSVLAGRAPHGSAGTSGGSAGAHAPVPTLIASYRAQIGSFQRPIYTASQIASIPNFSKDKAASTKLQSHLPDINNVYPTDADWKTICKDRKQVAEDLLDKERTWTNQREEVVDVCLTWLEKKHPRLGLCDDSRWKAMNVLKARFEEARKPITAGSRVGGARKRESEVVDEDEEEDAAGLAAIGLGTASSSKGKAKAKVAKKTRETSHDISVDGTS